MNSHTIEIDRLAFLGTLGRIDVSDITWSRNSLSNISLPILSVHGDIPSDINIVYTYDGFGEAIPIGKFYDWVYCFSSFCRNGIIEVIEGKDKNTNNYHLWILDNSIKTTFVIPSDGRFYERADTVYGRNEFDGIEIPF